MPIYMKLDGVDGEATDVGHANEIELLSVAWGASQTAGGTGVSRRARPVVQDIVVTKALDKSSPKLMQAVVQGTTFKNGQLTLTRQSGDTNMVYLTIKMTDVLITSYSISGSGAGDPRPIESLSLNFTKVEFNYIPLNPTGTPGTPVIAIIDKTVKN